MDTAIHTMLPDQSDTKGKESGPGSIITMSVSRGGERDSHAESHGKVVQEDVTLEENFGWVRFARPELPRI